MVGSVDYNRTEQTKTEGFDGNVLDGQVNVWAEKLLFGLAAV